MDPCDWSLAGASRAWLLALLAVACLSPACARHSLPLAPVTGSVTVGGRPVGQGRITFQPVDGRRPSSSRLAADGRYVLGTFAAGDGAVVGDHAVTIDARATDGPQPTSLADELERPNPQTSSVRWLVPERYASASTSPLRATVGPGRNVLDFDVPASEAAAGPSAARP